MAAIFEESDVPEQWKEYTAKNAEPFKDGGTLPKAPTPEKWEEAKKDPTSDAAKYYIRRTRPRARLRGGAFQSSPSPC